MKPNFSRRSQYFFPTVRREASGTVEKYRHLRSYWSSFCRLIVQDAQTVVLFAVGGGSGKDVGGIQSLSKECGIAREVDVSVHIDEQTTGHGERGQEATGKIKEKSEKGIPRMWTRLTRVLSDLRTHMTVINILLEERSRLFPFDHHFLRSDLLVPRPRPRLR